SPPPPHTHTHTHLGSERESPQGPWNLMIKHRYVQRRGRRSHTTVRSVLFSEVPEACVYVLQFFEKAAENVKENVGDDVQPDLLIREAYRNVLEHVRSLPIWDPSRLTDGSTFVLGSRANKALGMGGTRGRIYIKHADLFKYAADSKDKQWLAERHHMRATGGKMAYLLIEEDIQDLSHSDEYKDCPDVRMDELKPFSVPPWMVEKMQRAMEAQRDSDP
uniref:Deoxynucleotidyltransferase terminal-interacting protein 1 n=1 Tax=Nothobranchius furzeri TaxID=105023 RepID=A0A8C6LC87_NOTFU